MTHATLLEKALTLLAQAGVREGAFAHEPSGLHFLRYERSAGQDAALYRPLLCLVLQGAKQVAANAQTLTAEAGRSLVVSHTLPIVSRITEAAPDRPYVALVLPLDLDLLRTLTPDLPPARTADRGAPFSIALRRTDHEMEEALLRYLRHCETEETRRLLAPIARREIHARLLLGPHGDQLAKLLWRETAASRIHQATRAIQSNLTRRLVVGDLAHQIGMSSSAFFEHFRAVTGTTPLQYQKDLRLLQARDALRGAEAKISEIAFRVGYESSAQFSRDYARKFGRPPREDRRPTPLA